MNPETSTMEATGTCRQPTTAASASSDEGIGGAPCTVIEPQHGWRLVDFHELWRCRELAYFLCWRDIKVRYKQTALGVLWAVIQPLLTVVVFTVLFGRLTGLQRQMSSPYEIFVLAGLLPWTLFSQALARSSQSVVSSANLVTKVYFPRILIPMAATGACLVDFTIAGVILALLMVCYGVAVSASLLLFPIFVLLAFVAALGVGIFISALNVAYRDFKYVVPFTIQIWMFLTPVIYPVKIIPEKWRWLLALNPMLGAINGCRACLIPEFTFDWGHIGLSAGVATGALVSGVAYFRRVERTFADII